MVISAGTYRIRGYEQFSANNFNNLDQMDNFLEKCNLLKHTGNKGQNLNNSMSSK